MNKNQAYFILISTFILIVAWIIFSIIQSRINSTISLPLTGQIAPINPTFDMQTITALKKRTLVSPVTQPFSETATNAAEQKQQVTNTGSSSAIPNNNTL